MIAALALLLAAQDVSTAPDAKSVFESRQTDLQILARHLGGLHRLNQICPSYGRVSIFRDRMREIIDGEKPPRETREGMISRFNDGYREMTRLHYSCDYNAESDFRSEALNALSVSERLSGPLPTGE